MTTHLNEATLNALVDDELDDVARVRVETHLSGCADCAADVAAMRALHRDVGALPRGIAPERDLLPGIHAAIDGGLALSPLALADPAPTPRRGWTERSVRSVRWALAAAAVVLAALSSALTALVLRPAAPVAIAGVAPGAVPTGELNNLEARLIAATDELEGVLHSERAQLAPETVRILEENLAIVDAALAEARAALRADPGNPTLSEILMATYEKKLELLRSAAASVLS
jgi:anti-sigma factor RsiW